MYTQCPQCKTLFRLGADQIRAAAGQVRCGRCDTVFDALEHAAAGQLSTTAAAPKGPLIGSPAPGRPPAAAPALPTASHPPSTRVAAEQKVVAPEPETAKPVAPAVPDEAEQWQHFSESHIESLLRRDPPADGIPLAEDFEPYSTLDDLEVDLDRPSSGIHDKVEEAPATPRVAPPAAVTVHQETGDEPDSRPPTRGEAHAAALPSIPLSLEPPTRRQRPLTRTLAWGAGVIALCGMLALQYVHFNAPEVAARPGWRDYVDRLCGYTQCQLPPRRDTGRIELADHAVQSHPRAAGALLITATLRNAAEFPQPYPNVEVRMTDLNQRVVASRQFSPAEYLAGREPDSAFDAGAEAHLILEVLDPGPEAVSFQFDFH